MALAGWQISTPESDAAVANQDVARLVAVAARVPLLPSKLLDMLAVRLGCASRISGSTSGPVNAYVRARVCERVTFAHTLGLSAASILGHEHGAVVQIELAPAATAKPETRQPTAVGRSSSAMGGGDGAVSVQREVRRVAGMEASDAREASD